MYAASSHTSFAWSRFVAAQYTSAPGSPSKNPTSSLTAAASVVFPFFRATSWYAFRNRRVPSARFHPNTDPT